METNLNNMEERLWNYIDGTADSNEVSVIEQLIRDNAEWKAQYQELLDVNNLLQASELDEPSMRFTKNVMEEISKLHITPATSTYINKNIIRGIGIFFITLIVAFLAYGFSQVNWSTQGTSNLPVDFNKVDYSKLFNNNYTNAFILVNVILGLFLFDRFLANKRKQFRGDI